MPFLTGLGYVLFGSGALVAVVKVLTNFGVIPH